MLRPGVLPSWAPRKPSEPQRLASEKERENAPGGDRDRHGKTQELLKRYRNESCGKIID
jgi:hypothetical protein